MKFIDEAKIEVRAGDGGDGCSSFRREKYVPRGGPDGGDGGRGGHVLIRADEGLSTLMDLKYRRIVRAGRGAHGKGKQMNGAAGKDELIIVPLGTIVYEGNRKLADLTKHGEEIIIAKGGRGGRGNIHFATSTNQAPRRKDPGGEGEVRNLRLELKLLADVGLIGMPNVGKSTLISSISAARPKIADYPFTTIAPNLGVVYVGHGSSFTVADIPGLIEHAHEGAGLGVRFLKHVERTRLLVHLIDLSDPLSGDPLKNYEMIRSELGSYDKSLLERPELIVLTKMDLPDVALLSKTAEKAFAKKKLKVYKISAVAHEGLKTLVQTMHDNLAKIRSI